MTMTWIPLTILMKFTPLAGIETYHTEPSLADLLMKFTPLAGIETHTQNDQKFSLLQ